MAERRNLKRAAIGAALTGLVRRARREEALQQQQQADEQLTKY